MNVVDISAYGFGPARLAFTLTASVYRACRDTPLYLCVEMKFSKGTL